MLFRSHGIAERAAAGTPRAPMGSRAAFERRWILTRPHFARACVAVSELALEEGLETRSPLLDRRVVNCAASRPRVEHGSMGEKKLLLRRAMRGLLPDPVLARRPFKTGSLAGYFLRSVRTVEPLLRSTSKAPLLAEIGVIDRTSFRQAVERYCHTWSDLQLGTQLLATLQAELWLRERFSEAGEELPRACDQAATATCSAG